MINIDNFAGKKFAKLTAVKFIEMKNGRQMWLFKCDCGNEIITRRSRVFETTKSCGCLAIEKKRLLKNSKTHGHTTNNKISSTYGIWNAIKSRCLRKNCPEYKYYGERGIKICEKWMKFEGFLEDMGERPGGMSIDRINNEDGYYKENCRWATRKEQARNTRKNTFLTINGEAKTIAEWAEISKLNSTTIIRRLKLGWKEDFLLIKPLTPKQSGLAAIKKQLSDG